MFLFVFVYWNNHQRNTLTMSLDIQELMKNGTVSKTNSKESQSNLKLIGKLSVEFLCIKTHFANFAKDVFFIHIA